MTVFQLSVTVTQLLPSLTSESGIMGKVKLINTSSKISTSCRRHRTPGCILHCADVVNVICNGHNMVSLLKSGGARYINIGYTCTSKTVALTQIKLDIIR